MSKNPLLELNAHLTARLDDLAGADLDDGETLAKIVKRAEATVKVADAMVGNGRLVLDAAKFMADQGIPIKRDDIAMLPGAGARDKDAPPASKAE